MSNILGDSFKKAIELPDLEVVKLSIPEVGEAFGCGGVPRGRAIELYGTKSSGKTSISQWFVREFQSQGLKCAWAPVEPFDKTYAQSAGIDLSNLTVIDFGYGEDLLFKLKLALASNEFDLIVVDSINAVVPSGLMDATIESKSMHEKMEAPKMWAEFFRQLDGGYHIKSPVTGKLIKSNVVTKNINPKTLTEEEDPYWHKLTQKKTVMLFINHRMEKVGVLFGSKYYTPGGSRKDFTFSLRLNLDVKETKMGKVQGVETLKYKIIRVKPEKNRVGPPLKSIFLKLYPDGQLEFFGFNTKGLKKKVDSSEEAEINNLKVSNEDKFSLLKRKLSDGS